MKSYKVAVLAAMIVGLSASVSSAASVVGLEDWNFYVDGATYVALDGDSMPTSGTLTDGLGTLTWSTNVTGSHTFIAMFDHEIDEVANSYFNENGFASGSPAAGQSWEIDEPYVFGDIYWNVLDGLLDGSNFTNVYGDDYFAPEDVALALGWNFDLLAGQSATITLSLSEEMPISGFYLGQVDPESNDYTIYFSSDLAISGGLAPIPEPATMFLVGTGLAGLFGYNRRKKAIG